MCFVDNVSRNGWIGFSLFFFVFDSRVMKVVWLVLLVVLVGGVCCEEGVYEGIGGDVMMVLEIAQEVAGFFLFLFLFFFVLFCFFFFFLFSFFFFLFFLFFSFLFFSFLSIQFFIFFKTFFFFF